MEFLIALHSTEVLSDQACSVARLVSASHPFSDAQAHSCITQKRTGWLLAIDPGSGLSESDPTRPFECYSQMTEGRRSSATCFPAGFGPIAERQVLAANGQMPPVGLQLAAAGHLLTATE